MRHFRDRSDAKYLRDLDSMHYIMPLIFPNRCDNEAYMSMDVVIENTEEFIRKQNEGRKEEDRYSIFGVVIAAALQTIYKRPQLNRFIANVNMYQRNGVNAAFVVKKSLADEAEETLARIEATGEDNLESIQKQINDQIRSCKVNDDQSTESMNIIQKLPFKKLIGRLARWADRHGWMPKSVIATDPYQCSVVLTNLGSIGMSIGYHHLMNWGTNSIFIVVGKKVNKVFYDNDGNVKETKKVLRLSFTVDERISDGFYFGKSLRMLKKLVENPELMLAKFDEN
ncbi:MAG: 2-oxo acid dehydrogenase subunit E2 [Lachnospiraceae bacterium]|nr:2-oxo acid dehydrogenase subunit E2 [Lachnospiraceae bacterium]